MNGVPTGIASLATPEAVTGLLPGHDFADSLRVLLKGETLTAAEAARRAFAHPPAWTQALMRLRNRIVGLFGLKAAGDFTTAAQTIGGFPIVSESPGRVVLGFDDHHLDFRIVIEAAATGPGTAGQGTAVTVSTVVRTHNLLGRAYLAAVMPFHKIISRDSMRRIATES